MRKIIVSLFFSFGILNSSAQSNYFKKIVQPAFAAVTQSGAVKMVATADNGYVFVGNCVWTSACGLGAALFKFDSAGTLLWNLSLYTHNENMFDAIATPDSGVIAVGAALYSFPPTNIATLVVKVNRLGNIVWSRVDTLVNFSQFGFSILPSGDGNYIVQAGNEMVVYKISPAGNLLWHLSYNYGCSHIRAVNTPDGNITSLYSGVGTGSPDVIVRLNPSGNITQVRHIVSSPPGLIANYISKTIDNGFLIAGNYNYSGEFTSWNSDTAAVIKTDSSFNVQLAKLYINDDFIITGACQINSSNIIVSANIIDTAGPVDRHFILMKLDATGNIIQAVENNSESFAVSIDQWGNDIFISGGYGDDSSPNDFLVVKTDTAFSNICGDPITTNQSSFTVSFVPFPPYSLTSWNAVWQNFTLNPVYSLTNVNECILTSEEELKNNGIMLYPNPATNQLTIENGELKIDRIEIYNVLGEKVYQERLASDIGRPTISVADFPAGVYLLKVRGEKEERIEKFVKE